MKQAHKYRLIVKWSNRPDWNINILAIDAEAVSTWLPCDGSSVSENEERYITSVEIQLIERNAEMVKDNFVARGLDIIN
jgi:hypothetical protein